MDRSPLDHGAVGDGVVDDTVAVQETLNACSYDGGTCRLPSGYTFRITAPLYLWGASSLSGSATLLFDGVLTPYLVNAGIRGPQQLEAPFSGAVRDVTFRVKNGPGGRVLYFWRTDGALIDGNTFDVGSLAYSATSSGNDNNVVANAFVNMVRRRITLTNNRMFATATNVGSEGFGLVWFQGGTVAHNVVRGVGDDPIGMHFCTDFRIIGNDVESVDGRIFLASCKRLYVAQNRHTRVRSPRTNQAHAGISLLYIGFESLKGGNAYPAPTDIEVVGNTLTYSEGAVDNGAAIYLYGCRGVTLDGNTIHNASTTVTASGVHILPAKFQQAWTDPDGLDGTMTARTHAVAVRGTRSVGVVPLGVKMTGNCVDHVGPIVVESNVAGSFDLYCPSATSSNNVVIS